MGVRDELGLQAKADAAATASPTEEAVGVHPHRLLPIDSLIAQCEGVLTSLDAMKAQVQGLLIAAVDLRLREMGGEGEKDRIRAKMAMTMTGDHDTVGNGVGVGGGSEQPPERGSAPEPKADPNNHASPAPGRDQSRERGSYETGRTQSVPCPTNHETIADVSTMGGGKKWYCFDCDTEIEV